MRARCARGAGDALDFFIGHGAGHHAGDGFHFRHTNLTRNTVRNSLGADHGFHSHFADGDLLGANLAFEGDGPHGNGLRDAFGHPVALANRNPLLANRRFHPNGADRHDLLNNLSLDPATNHRDRLRAALPH